MRSIKNIKKRIKNVNIVIDSERNKKVFNNILRAFEKSKAKELTPTGVNIGIIISRSSITKIAAAAVIILGVTLFITQNNPDKQEQPNNMKATQTPTEMMTAISLERAFRRGGIEAVENQCEQALKLLGTRTFSFSSNELPRNLNGS